MKSRVAILVCLAGFSLAASAMPHASLNQLVEQSDPNCSEAGNASGLKDLIEQIGLIKQQNEDGSFLLDNDGKALDPRGSILDLGPKIGLANKDIIRSRYTTGYMICPHAPDAGGAAALIGDGTHIITSAHLFTDDFGGYKDDLSDCFFQNQASPNKRVQLKFNRDPSKNIFSRDPSRDGENDIAVVEIDLKSLPDGKFLPPGIKPFPLDDSESVLTKGQKVVMISASAKNMKRPVDPNIPVVQACHYEKSMAYDGARKVYGVYTDCTAYKGQSGSIQLVKVRSLNKDNKYVEQWAIRAITSAGPKGAVEGGEFNADSTDKRKPLNYTFGTEITSDIIAKINNFVVANNNSRSFVEARGPQ